MRILFVRTFRQLLGGGPVPPLGILYLASALRERFGPRLDIKIIDLGRMAWDEAADELRRYAPHYIGLSAMSCEAGVMSGFAELAKANFPDVKIIAGGPHASALKERLLDDANIDCAVIGEGEAAIVELLDAFESGGGLSGVAGIAYRDGGGRAVTRPRAPIENPDALPFPAWDIIDIKGYGAYPNWNGVLKEDFYAVVSSSRGCPYRCSFCHNIFGKRARMRSPENVFGELKELRERFGVREIHFVDDVFNIDAGRAERLCELIIEYGRPFSLAFPNGLRADIMTEKLIRLLKKAGTYKIHYGFETVSPRLQEQIGKNLDIAKAVEAIEATSRAGIITGAYFMFGFPGETREEIMRTIDFAAGSKLDSAYFFKATAYPGSGFFDNAEERFPDDFSDYHFYSGGRSHGDLDEVELNSFILLAQQRFYLKFGRLRRGFRKSPRKTAWLKNLAAVFAVALQAYLFRAMAKPAPEKNA